MSYPENADGDALRRVAGDGSDMTKPMLVDFMVAVPDERTGRQFAERVRTLGFEPKVERDSESQTWTCYCSKQMVPAYEAIILAQDDLDEMAKPFGGYSDGWGTLGNKAGDGQPHAGG